MLTHVHLCVSLDNGTQSTGEPWLIAAARVNQSLLVLEYASPLHASVVSADDVFQLTRHTGGVGCQEVQTLSTCQALANAHRSPCPEVVAEGTLFQFTNCVGEPLRSRNMSMRLSSKRILTT